MSVFADSSALVKLYAYEQGSECVRELGQLIVSQVARVEVPAAIWRKNRVNALSAGDASVLIAVFEDDYYGFDEKRPRFVTVAVTSRVLDTAARLTGVHGLRVYDAVQLASAQEVAAVDPGCKTFAAFDGGLRSAAATEGFALMP